MTEPGGLQAWRLAASMKWICVDFMDSWGIWCPWLDFLWISSNLYDFRWICVDFMDLGVFWWEKVSRPVTRHYMGVVAIKEFAILEPPF